MATSGKGQRPAMSTGESYRKVIVVSVLAHVGSSTWTIVMVFWYTGCWQNIVVLVTTIILLAIMYKISLKLKSKAPGFFMEPGLVAVYMVFLRWLAITSEPETGCYKKDKAGAISMTALAFGAGLISATVSAFSTGTQYTSIQGRNHHMGTNFFHFVFATGCMYFGMLFLGWETQLQHTTAEIRWMSGWMSTGVYIVIECAVAISFVAIQLARIYGIGWLEQKLSRIFGTAGQLLQQGQGQQQAPSARPPVSQTMDDPPPASPPRSSATTEEYLSD
ncbi:hypothetical protein BS78_08G001900 [Paspalum vaginatum]|nr:hypothetical protein BS78_08G001900 [Paspalum vaginatum]